MPQLELSISPNYAQGFTFSWDVNSRLADPFPWNTRIETSPVPDGPWDLVGHAEENLFSLIQTERYRLPKGRVLYYRAVMTTPKDEYVSPVISPYNTLSRRDLLRAREIIRNEVQQLRLSSGVCIELLIKSRHGPKCTDCIDAITGGMPDPFCETCQGSGRSPGYHGPYQTIGSWSQVQQKAAMEADGTDLRDDRAYQVRVPATIPFEKDDIVRDPAQGKSYYVHAVRAVAEIRRVPLVWQVTVRESPLTAPSVQLAGEGA